MKLNPHILTTTIALLASAAFAADLELETPKSAATSATVSSSGGKATITIDVNGKKETREIELGDGVEIKTAVDPTVSATASTLTKGQSTERRTWLGVAPEELPEELRAQLPVESGTGLIVRSVVAESPAAAAGLQKNDVLLKFDDQLLTNPQQLRTLVSAKKDGDTVKITYFRRGRQATVDAKLVTHEESFGGGDVSVLSELPKLGELFRKWPRALIFDKEGKVMENEKIDLDETVEKIAKALRGVGADEKSIDDATRALKDTTKAINDAVRDAVVAKDEAMKGSGEIAKALEQVRDALEKVRQQTEDAVKKDREKREEQKRP